VQKLVEVSLCRERYHKHHHFGLVRNAFVIQSHWEIWVARGYASTFAMGLAIVGTNVWVSFILENYGKICYLKVVIIWKVQMMYKG